MKICVYAIAKNEEKFAKDWLESMSEADEICVLDTGSTDNTAQTLEKLGAKVKTEKTDPFRFDVARNKSLELVPCDTDLCICTDLDERFEKGWRKHLEKVYSPDIKQYKYRYTWSFLSDGQEGVVFWTEKIHTRHDFVWTHPVHEVLKYIGKQPYKNAFVPNMQLNHYPDHTKSRKSYLPLLELSVAEDPFNDRNMHYLGREYMFDGQYEKAIATLKKHLQLKSATWADERCASMRFRAKCYLYKQDFFNAKLWLHNAIAQAPWLREPYIDFATLCYSQQDWHGVVFFVTKALEIADRSMSYINEPQCWGAYPHDMLSIAYFYLNDLPNALLHSKIACQLADDERIVKNKLFFEEKLKQSTKN